MKFRLHTSLLVGVLLLLNAGLLIFLHMPVGFLFLSLFAPLVVYTFGSFLRLSDRYRLVDEDGFRSNASHMKAIDLHYLNPFCVFWVNATDPDLAMRFASCRRLLRLTFLSWVLCVVLTVWLG